VYIREREDGPLVFLPLPTPTHAEVADVARGTAERIECILRAHGRSLDPEMQDDEPPALCLDEPGLAACYAAAAQGIALTGERAGQSALRLVGSQTPRADTPAARDNNDPVAEVRGINVHARRVVGGRDRPQIERLCRYVTRPPLAQERLELRSDGRLELTLKNIWRDGTRAIIFEPHDLLARLVAAVPPPNFHSLRYFGVLSGHSALRGEVVPESEDDPLQRRPPPAAGDQLELLSDDDCRPPARKRWAWLLKHVFQADVDSCIRCGGPMRWVEAATTPEPIARLMAKHGFAPRAPPTRRPPLAMQLELPFG
jgi:hypothetical protein